MKDFKQLKIWQKGFEIAVQTYRFAAPLPKAGQFTLCSQMTKAAVSIPSNIAEGSSRSSVKEYNRFVEISLGSSYEVETQLLVAQAVFFGDPELCKNLLATINEDKECYPVFKKAWQSELKSCSNCQASLVAKGLQLSYLATFTALFSLITVTLIWPG